MGVEQRIAEDGEMQVKSPGVMMGYFKNVAATKETMTEDGWLRTGDKGELDDMGRFRITGRRAAQVSVLDYDACLSCTMVV